jgi:hypothetical protein
MFEPHIFKDLVTELLTDITLRHVNEKVDLAIHSTLKVKVA